MLITTRFADTVQVHLVRMPGGARTQQTFLASHVAWASFEPNHSNYFVFKMDDAGSEIYHLYRYDLASGDITQLTIGDDSVSNVVWLKTAQGLVFSSATRDGENTDFVMLNPLAPQHARRLTRVKGFGWDVMDVAPNDQQVLMSEFVSAEETAIHLLDVGTGTLKRITPPPDNEKVAYWNAAFSRDGKGVYLTTDQASEHARLAYLSLASGQSSWLPIKQQGAVESFALSPDGRRLAYIVNEEGIGRLRLFDVSAGRGSEVPKLPVGIVSNLNWQSNDEVGFNLETARYPADIYSLKVATHTIERWTYSETGGVSTDDFRDAELIRWRSFDGREISGFLCRPPVRFTGARPVMIDIHGGPQLQARPSYSGRYNYYLNELGMVIIYPNVRGSFGFGKSFLALDNGARRADALQDLRALLDWIKTQPNFDSRRVVLRGESYGGYLALALAVTDSARIRGVIAESAITSIPSYIENTDAALRPYLRAEYGDERKPQQRSLLDTISPTGNVGKISVPMLLAAGKNDIRVPFAETEKLVRAAQARSLPVWYLLASNEGHIFGRKQNRDYLFYATAFFMQQFVLN